MFTHRSQPNKLFSITVPTNQVRQTLWNFVHECAQAFLNWPVWASVQKWVSLEIGKFPQLVDPDLFQGTTHVTWKSFDSHVSLLFQKILIASMHKVMMLILLQRPHLHRYTLGLILIIKNPLIIQRWRWHHSHQDVEKKYLALWKTQGKEMTIVS